MNKKLIIGIVIASVVVIGVGVIYLHNRNKKATDKKPNLATESEALEMVDLIGKKDEPLSIEKTKKFVDLYMVNIDEDLHKRLIAVLNKKESTATSKDKLDWATLEEKVIVPMRFSKNK